MEPDFNALVDALTGALGAKNYPLVAAAGVVLLVALVRRFAPAGSWLTGGRGGVALSFAGALAAAGMEALVKGEPLSLGLGVRALFTAVTASGIFTLGKHALQKPLAEPKGPSASEVLDVLKKGPLMLLVAGLALGAPARADDGAGAKAFEYGLSSTEPEGALVRSGFVEVVTDPDASTTIEVGPGLYLNEPARLMLETAITRDAELIRALKDERTALLARPPPPPWWLLPVALTLGAAAGAGVVFVLTSR